MIQSLLKLYMQYRNYVVFVVLLIISLTLVTLNSSDRISTPRKVSLYCFGLINSLFKPINEFSAVKSENFYLLKQNVLLMDELNELRSSKDELNELRKLINLKKQNLISFIPGRIIYKSLTPSFNYFIVDVGKKDGVIENLPVITADGIIGIIHQTLDDISIIKTIKNHDFKISVVSDSGVLGILKWNGNSFRINNIPKSAIIKEGDRFYSSEFSSIFPNKIPVGYIKKIFQGNEIPFFDVNLELNQNLEKVKSVFILPQDLRINDVVIKYERAER